MGRAGCRDQRGFWGESPRFGGISGCSDSWGCLKSWHHFPQEISPGWPGLQGWQTFQGLGEKCSRGPGGYAVEGKGGSVLQAWWWFTPLSFWLSFSFIAKSIISGLEQFIQEFSIVHKMLLFKYCLLWFCDTQSHTSIFPRLWNRCWGWSVSLLLCIQCKKIGAPQGSAQLPASVTWPPCGLNHRLPQP